MKSPSPSPTRATPPSSRTCIAIDRFLVLESLVKSEVLTFSFASATLCPVANEPHPQTPSLRGRSFVCVIHHNMVQ